MPKETLRLGVVARSHPPVSQWAERVLRPFAVMTDLPPLAPGTLMAEAEGVRTQYLGDHALTLYSSETKHYRDNLAQARPAIWVALAGEEVRLATADPYEGEALASDPEKVVEAVAMPPALAARIEEFIACHHREEPFVKRRRSPAPGAEGARAPRILSADQKWGKR